LCRFHPRKERITVSEDEIEAINDGLSELSGKFYRLLEKLLEKGVLSQAEYLAIIEGL
jgi:hypothetical protein